MSRIVVAIDPSGSAGQASDRAGISVAGLGVDGHYYVFRDPSGVMTANAQAERLSICITNTGQKHVSRNKLWRSLD